MAMMKRSKRSDVDRSRSFKTLCALIACSTIVVLVATRY